MTLPAHDTIVTYPAGELEQRAVVVHTAPAGDGLLAVVTDTTPFHPVDAAWPDQAADTGALRSSRSGVGVVQPPCRWLRLIGSSRSGGVRSLPASPQ